MTKKDKSLSELPQVPAAVSELLQTRDVDTLIVCVRTAKSKPMPERLVEELQRDVFEQRLVKSKIDKSRLSKEQLESARVTALKDLKSYVNAGLVRNAGHTLLVTVPMFDRLQATIELLHKQVTTSLVSLGHGRSALLLEPCKPLTKEYDHFLRVLRFGEALDNPYANEQ